MSSYAWPKGDNEVDLDNLDDLLAALTAEEIDELNGELDPDNTNLPPSARCKEQTSKDPTGPFNRQNLLSFLEEKAKHEKDWENTVPFNKEPKGKKFVPREPVVSSNNGNEDALETEWDDILKQATEEELVDLASLLEVQYHYGEFSEEGSTGRVQAAPLRLIPDEAPNSTNIEESIKKLKANDKNLKSLNINNIKNVSPERLIEVCEAFKGNTTCLSLNMASVDATDRVARALAESLAENETLKIVNVESNFISGQAIVQLFKGINKKQSILELRVANQKPEVLGNKVEMEISRLMKENNTLLRLGIHFEYPDARIKVHTKLKENFDVLRKKRQAAKDS